MLQDINVGDANKESIIGLGYLPQKKATTLGKRGEPCKTRKLLKPTAFDNHSVSITDRALGVLLF